RTTSAAGCGLTSGSDATDGCCVGSIACEADVSFDSNAAASGEGEPRQDTTPKDTTPSTMTPTTLHNAGDQGLCKGIWAGESSPLLESLCMLKSCGVSMGTVAGSGGSGVVETGAGRTAALVACSVSDCRSCSEVTGAT